MEITIMKPLGESGRKARAEEFGVRADSDCNGAAMRRAIQHCKNEGIGELLVQPGVYRFGAGQHPVFEELSDFRFDGGGAEFVFRSAEAFIAIRHCRRMEFRNLTVDWDWDLSPLASIGVVERVSEDTSWFELAFPEYESVPAGLDIRTLNPMNPRTLTPGCEWGREFGGNVLGEVLEVRGNIMRIALPDPENFRFLNRGQAYIVRHYVYDAPAFELHENEHLKLEEVTVYGAPGHAFVATGGQHHWGLARCRLLKRPGTTRCISATADGCHISNSLGSFLMEYCDFSGNGDDCLNIHDNSVQNFERLDSRSIAIGNVFPWRNPFAPGDPVEFRNPDLSPTGVTATVADADWDERGQRCVLTFGEALPSDLSAKAILFNRRYNSGHYVVRHNFFHHNRARGVLLHASDGLVEHNYFYRNQGPAIQIECGAEARWAEGFGVDNLTIRNNRIESCDVNHWSMAVIYMGVYLEQGRTSYPIFRDIAIERNTIVDCPQQAVFVSSCERVAIRGNALLNPNAGPPKSDQEGDANCVPNRSLYQGTIMASHCREVVIEHNRRIAVAPAADDRIWVEADSAGSVEIRGNHGFLEVG
jgi:hypothetical protein